MWRQTGRHEIQCHRIQWGHKGQQLAIHIAVGSTDQIQLSFRSNELNETQINRYFELQANSHMLKSNYDLDELKIDLIELVFICTVPAKADKSSGNRSRSNRFLLYITINDVNNKVPQFVAEPYALRP